MEYPLFLLTRRAPIFFPDHVLTPAALTPAAGALVDLDGKNCKKVSFAQWHYRAWTRQPTSYAFQAHGSDTAVPPRCPVFRYDPAT